MTTRDMSDLDAILIIEEEGGSEDEVVAAWQHLIDSGTVWKLQGWYGRFAARLIEEGVCHERPV